MWAVQEASALRAYAITRTITAAETGCVPVVRLVDFIGDDAVLPRIGGALDGLYVLFPVFRSGKINTEA